MPNRIVILETGGPDVLKYEKYNLKDKIDENNVRIKHHSIGINYIDTYHRSGIYHYRITHQFAQDLRHQVK